MLDFSPRVTMLTDKPPPPYISASFDGKISSLGSMLYSSVSEVDCKFSGSDTNAGGMLLDSTGGQGLK